MSIFYRKVQAGIIRSYLLISFLNLSREYYIDMTTRDPNLDMTQVILPELPNLRVEKHETEPDI